MNIKPGMKVLVMATVKAPCNHNKPSGLWWIELDGKIGLITAHEDAIVVQKSGEKDPDWENEKNEA